LGQKDPGRIGGKNYFSRKDAKKTSENAAALCVFAPLREKFPRQKTLFVQNPSGIARSAREQSGGRPPHSRETPKARTAQVRFSDYHALPEETSKG